MIKELLSISTRIKRPDEDGNMEDWDVLVSYSIDSYKPGCPARIHWDENDYPAEPAEYEFSFVSAEIDKPGVDDKPLTDAEIAALQTWFADNTDKAAEADDQFMSRERCDDY